MAGTYTYLIALILICIALIGYLVMRPSVTATLGGKILAFVALFIFPVLAGGMGIQRRQPSASHAMSWMIMAKV
jgi:hypothetical protein